MIAVQIICNLMVKMSVTFQSCTYENGIHHPSAVKPVNLADMTVSDLREITEEISSCEFWKDTNIAVS